MSLGSVPQLEHLRGVILPSSSPLILPLAVTGLSAVHLPTQACHRDASISLVVDHKMPPAS